jgi:Undecaprenyl-phosphate glucose phosphotransferase
MIRRRLNNARFVLRLTIFSMPLAAFGLAAYLRFATHLLPRYSSDANPSSYFGLLILTTVLWAIIAEHQKLVAIDYLCFDNRKIRSVLSACLITYLAVLSITFFYRDFTFSRVFIWLTGISLLLLTLVALAIFDWAWGKNGSHDKARFTVLIAGADEFAVRVAESLLAGHVPACTIKGHIRLAGQECVVRGIPVYELSDVEELAIGNGIDDVVLAIVPTLLGALPELRRQLSPLSAPVRLVLDVGEPVDSRQRLFTLGNLVMLDLQATPADSPLYVILKRAFDLAFSACVLILAAPIFFLIALAIWVSSPGPIIFVQERVGLNGKLFRMFKFRTMKMSSVAESDARWTVQNDPRCTRVGKMLRKTGLDELPQFFNVLKGEMSVVGPRPERPILVQKFMQSVGNYNRRHYLKVGITGWAQVNGWRGDTSIAKRVEYDLYYVRHWTMTFDLLIVALTLVRSFTDKNAY